MDAITRRDYHAAHAPECPAWFTVPREDNPDRPASVLAHDLLSEEFRKFNLTDPAPGSDWTKRRDEYVARVNASYRETEADHAAWSAACAAVANRNELARQCAWRWYWADAMLTAAEEV